MSVGYVVDHVLACHAGWIYVFVVGVNVESFSRRFVYKPAGTIGVEQFVHPTMAL
jgi:hypothetical protein